jgi:hypothetical protein
MAKVNTVKTATCAVFSGATLNQTQFVRTAIAALWDRAAILQGLADHYCLADPATGLKWAKGRLALYERAYGPLGVADRKAMASFTGWSCK